MENDKREDFVKAVKKELIGPDPIVRQENGEEILCTDNPSSRYFSAILYPKSDNVEEDSSESSDGNVQQKDSAKNEEAVVSPLLVAGSGANYYSEETEECINLSNAFKQSAISLTVVLAAGEKVTASIDYALYRRDKNPTDPKKEAYFREPKHADVGPVSRDDLKEAYQKGAPFHFVIQGTEAEKELVLYCFYRCHSKDDGVELFTFSLVNEFLSNKKHDDAHSFFQVCFKLANSAGFKEIPSDSVETAWLSDEEKEEREENELLYRNEKQYAFGHGCSPQWTEDGQVYEITASFMPIYQLKAIAQGPQTKLSLSMKSFFDDANGQSYSFPALRELEGQYKNWIEKCRDEAGGLPKKLVPAAKANISKCEECLSRINKGIELLESNSIAYEAFRLANEAMLMQQLHSAIKTRHWTKSKYGANDRLEDETPFVLPDINDPKTWPSKKVFGQWYTFQLAFLLLSISSIVDKTSPEHQYVELIWFPTGGGKTEAYLGLSAFTIFYSRLTKTDDGTCTKIIMRYTLRLLTSQQYERAAALICSCEHIRAFDITKSLGDKPISIGLWVGSKMTPNTDAEAVKKYEELLRTHSDSNNPFVIVRCPWCGAEMGVSEKPTTRRVFGYEKREIQGKKTVGFRCSNPVCEFHSKNLPLLVIDEDIYRMPPTLLIGTADKFALIPYYPQIRSIFGLSDGPKVGRQDPELIIQDELHLISGPLGSMIGAYEFAFDTLCSYEEDGKMIHPKVVASTATISLAKAQCKSVFNVNGDQVKIFPQSCLTAGESFFSYVDKGKNGREYVGIYAPGSPSSSTSSIHLLASLMVAKQKIDFSQREEQKDAYWTNVCYFNALRELGQAATWINADINEHIKNICSWNDYQFPKKTPVCLELTSRVSDENLKDSFNKLETDISGKNGDPIDICLATNMISVGIDVSRLGLMTVFGQPKTTAEYIQATSRVGRKTDVMPGLVFVIYNPSKPRDKSVFEDFQVFHSKYYSFVEPTSVSVFSPELRRRALPAIFLGTAELLWCKDQSGSPKELLEEGKLAIVKKLLVSRISEVDPEESGQASLEIDEILSRIKTQAVIHFAFPIMQPVSETYISQNGASMLCSDGVDIPDGSKDITYFAPTSMRSVDKECRPFIISKYEKRGE